MAKKKVSKKSKSKKLPVKTITPSNSDDHLGKEITIACTGTDHLDITDLTEFQGKLKTLSEEKYEALKNSILELGFSFPVFAWKYRNKNFILDAHQRVKTLKRMRVEGYIVPKVPTVWIDAKDRHEAAKKLLAAVAQFGEVTPDGLNEFMSEFGLKMDDLLKIRLPEIDFESFALTYFPNMKDVAFQAKDEWTGMPEFDQQDKRAFRSIIIHFHDQSGVDKFAKAAGQKITEKTKYLWYPEIIIEKAFDKKYEN